jgi:hypothetical protein
MSSSIIDSTLVQFFPLLMWGYCRPAKRLAFGVKTFSRMTEEHKLEFLVETTYFN